MPTPNLLPVGVAARPRLRLSWPDIIAGLSLIGLLLPSSVAYAALASLPPQAGVVSLFAGLICYGLFGTSRFALVSATSSSAIMLAAASASMADGDSNLRLLIAFGVVMLTGLFFAIAGLARMGSASDFMAKPVLRGFSFGLAIVIVLKQFANIVGVAPQHGDVIRFVAELLGGLPAWNWPAALLAGIALALLFLMARVPRIPGGLVVIIIGIAAGKWLNLSQYGISLVGTIDLHLSAPTLPTLTYSEWLRIGEMSVAMVMILYAESYTSIRTFALKHGDIVLPNRDLLALGVANMVSGLFHGTPVGAGYSATAANEAAGALSQWAGWVAALTLFIVVLTILPAIALTPQPVLGAIVIQAVSHTLDISVFRPYFIWRRDRVVVVVAVLAVLAFGVLDGLLVAIAISLLMLLRRMAESSVTILGRLDHGHDFVSMTSYPTAEAIDGILILRPETALFFANAERILAQVGNLIAVAGADVHTIILSLEESPDLDSSSVEALRDFCVTILGQGRHLLFARLKAPAQRVLNRAAIPGLTMVSLCAFSVDEVVNLALKRHQSLQAGVAPQDVPYQRA